MTPRSDTVDQMFSRGDSIAAIATWFGCSTDEVESALRRDRIAADRKRGRK